MGRQHRQAETADRAVAPSREDNERVPAAPFPLALDVDRRVAMDTMGWKDERVLVRYRHVATSCAGRRRSWAACSVVLPPWPEIGGKINP